MIEIYLIPIIKIMNITKKILLGNGFVNKDIVFDLFGVEEHWNDCFERRFSDKIVAYKVDTNCLTVRHSCNHLCYFSITCYTTEKFNLAMQLLDINFKL